MRLVLGAMLSALGTTAVYGDRPTPMQTMGAQLRHDLREGNAQGFLAWCDKLGATHCPKADTHLGDSLLHVAAENGR